MNQFTAQMSPDRTAQMDQIRHFNRFYTRHMGLFSRDYLKVGLSVTELRIFHEIATGRGCAREIAKEMGLDEGYMSRLVKRYVSKGWLESTPSEDDARRRDLSLTAKGRAVYDDMVDLTRAETGRRLGDADPGQVVAAMQALERTMLPPDPEAVTLRDLAIGDMGWLIQRNAETYCSDFGFDAEFEVIAGQILIALLKHYDPATHAAAIAVNGEDRLGSIFLEPGGTPGVTKLRVFYVEPKARGLRLGHRLLTRCLEQARALGYRRVELMTVHTQVVARHLYAAYGFEMVEQFPVVFAGRDVLEEKWARDL